MKALVVWTVLAVGVGCGKGSSKDAVADGPPIAATGQLGKASVWTGHVVTLHRDGVLIALEDDAITALERTGAPRWRTVIDHDDWMLELPDGSIAVSDHAGKAIVALDPATGHEAWRVPWPAPPAVGEDDFDMDSHNPEAAAVIGGRVVLVLADARFVALDPAACAKAADCIAPMFALPDETVDDPFLVAGPGGDLILGEGGDSGLIRRFTPEGRIIASVFVRDALGGIAMLGGSRLAAVIDDELVIYDLDRCATARAVVLPRKRGRMHVEGEGECTECVSPPAGCVVARPELGGDVDFTPPLVLADGSVVVGTDEGLARVAGTGEVRWRSNAEMFGVLVEHDGEIVGLGSGVGDDLEEAPLRAMAVSAATGKVAWRRQLAVKAGFIISLDDLIAVAAPPHLVVGYKGAVSWLALPPPQGPR